MSQSSSRIGYTERQAKATHERVNRAVQKALAALEALETVLPDTGVHTSWMAEEIHAIENQLHSTIDRRKR